MIRTKTFHVVLATSLLLAAATVSAQLPMDIEFMAAPIAFDTATVSGAPYSAEAVTEFVQTLADGNRIARQSKAQIARDTAGRTRREQGLSMLGPMVNAPEEFRHVQITDPEAGTMVMLNLREKTAEKMPAPNVRMFTGVARQRTAVAGKAVTIISKKVEVGGQATTDTFEMALPAGAAGPGEPFVYSAQMSTSVSPGAPPVVESLGKQLIEGVEAEGTKT